MKLAFKRIKNGNTCDINVLQVVSGKEKEFIYVDMIKQLLESRKMEKPKISKAEFTEDEIASIYSMVDRINEVIKKK